jgi:uncharacterized protein (TIGR02996 family)
MTHDEAFLEDILAHPGDDAPRLIYADWLEEHGDPRRAEFIRLQCDLARMAEGDPRRPVLQAREWDLLAAHGAAWAGPLQGLVERPEFRRGFIEKVQVTAAVFLRDGEALFRLTPLREVVLREVGGDLPQVVHCPHLARLTVLGLSHNRIGAAGAAALASSPHLARLTELDLSDNGIGAEGATALAASPHLANLTTLLLGGNGIGAAGAAALAASPTWDASPPSASSRAASGLRVRGRWRPRPTWPASPAWAWSTTASGLRVRRRWRPRPAWPA